MRLKLITFFFFILLCINCDAFAVNGNDYYQNNNSSDGLSFTSAYDVDIMPIPGYPESNTGTDRAWPFWELPAYVQIAYISALFITILGIFKLAPFIFGRLKHALENPRTRDIFQFIQRNPGVTIAELSEEQKINRGTLKYHLSQLLAYNKITFIRKGKFSRLFYNTPSPMDRESIVSRHLKNENGSRILLKIMDMPGISNQELSDVFSLAKSTTHEYLKAFSDDGLIESRQDGKFKRYYLKQDVRMIILRYHHR